MIESTLGKLAAGEDLSRSEIGEALDRIMQGACAEGEIGLLLTGLRLKGETVEEIVGAAEVLRRHMSPLSTGRAGLLDTCGTGGDGSGTFNISTAAALVAAAAGVPVAKHGNRAASSKTGSADVLAELGVNIEAELPRVEACLEKLGFCFCYARRFHPSMKHVAAVRAKLGMPTIFNLLGPLCNPAGAPYQLLGAGRPGSQRLLAEALAVLGTERAVVVRGEDGLGEVSLAGPTDVLEVSGGQVREFRWEPADFGLEPAASDTLLADSAAGSAQIIRRVLAGESGPPRDVVLLNAAAAVWTAGAAEGTVDAARLAAVAVDNGAAAALLERLVEETNR